MGLEMADGDGEEEEEKVEESENRYGRMGRMSENPRTSKKTYKKSMNLRKGVNGI